MRPSNKNTIIKRHSAMVKDPLRTPLIAQAIEKTVKRGSIVFEIGTGTGVLTLLALKAGAKTVYTCEIDTSIRVAKENIRRAGFASQTVFFNELSSDIDLPEEVDILIAETVGSLGFNENILYYLTQARDKFLKQGGTLIPFSLSTYLAPTTQSPPSTLAKKTQKFIIDDISPDSIMAEAKEYFCADFSKIKSFGFDIEKKFTFTKNAKLQGMAGWVKINWTQDIVTTTSPWDPPTHWKQTFLPFSKPMQIRAGDELLFRLRIGPDPENPLESLIEWGYKHLSKK